MASVLFLITLIVISLSYKSIGSYFGRDYFHTYYKDTIIDDFIDPSSLKAFEGSVYTYDNKHFYSVQDEGNLKNPLKIMPGVDAESFKVISGGFAKDKNHVYFEGEKLTIEGLDREDFIPINYYYAKDRNQAYYLSYGAGEKVRIIPGADVQTFEIVEDLEGRNVAKDKK